MKVNSLSHTVFEKPQRTVCMLKYQLLRLFLSKHVSTNGNIVQFSSKQQTFSSLILQTFFHIHKVSLLS